MVVDHEVLPLLKWLMPNADGLGALLTFLQILFTLGVLSTLLAYLTCSLRHGPIEAFYRTASGLFGGIAQLAQTSPRRVLALAFLAVKEAIQRRVHVAFIIFVLIVAFAGWYLDQSSDDPSSLYISVVLGFTNLLIVLLSLFLSTFSLPSDIRDRTIYTIVTKPVRPGEIVLGRILGFSAVGTLFLVIMCGISYVFVVRGVSHSHAIDAGEMRADAITGGYYGQTTLQAEHRHEVNVGAKGAGISTTVNGHHHSIQQADAGGKPTFNVSSSEGVLQARIPRYGRLQFLDRSGRRVEKGINVGKEWTYRGYIEGATGSAAVWDFEGITKESFPNGLPLEMNIRVFRTFMGTFDRAIDDDRHTAAGIPGTIELVNPDPTQASPLTSEPITFEAREFSIDRKLIPAKLRAVKSDGSVQDIDLFDDLVHDGRLRLIIRGLDRGQYFGMAQADVYFHAGNEWFILNFIKGYTGIWLQMVLIICFGVMFSTFLSGAVASMAALSSLVLGFFAQFVIDVATRKIEGGGPLESTIRMIRGDAVTINLDPSIGTSIIQFFDWLLMGFMQQLAYVLPNYRMFNNADYVAYGYNIESALLGQHILIAVGYLVAVSCLSLFMLRSKEIAA